MKSSKSVQQGTFRVKFVLKKKKWPAGIEVEA